MHESIAFSTRRTCRSSVRRQSRRRMLSALILVLSIVTIVVFSICRTAQAEESLGLQKYYKSIVIQQEDTLWSLAEKFNENEEVSTTAYINEIRSINHIGSKIKSGMTLIVPYYE